MHTITAQVEDANKLEAIKKFMYDLDVAIEVEEDDDDDESYLSDPKFIESFNRGVAQMERGEVVRVDDIAKYLGL